MLKRARRTLVRIIFFVIFSWVAQIRCKGPEISFETIGTLRMRSFGLELNETNKKKQEAKNEQALSVPCDQHEQRRIVYKMCSEAEANKGSSNDNGNFKQVIEDLDVFFGRGKDKQATIYNKIFEGRIHTLFGEAMAAKKLATLETDTGKLKAQQALIAELAGNTALRVRLEQLLTQLHQSEGELLSFWGEESPFAKTLIDQMYFGKPLPDYFNKDVTKLELLARYNNLQILFGSIGELVVNTGMLYGAKKFMGYPVTLGDAALEAVSLYNPAIGIRDFRYHLSDEGYQTHLLQAVNDLHDSGHLVKEKAVHLRAATIQRVMCFFSGLRVAGSVMNTLAKASSIKMFVANFLQRRDIVNSFQERLIAVSAYIRAVREINVLAAEYPVILQALPEITDISYALFTSSNKDLRELVALLLSDTFTGTPSFFSRTGRVLAAYTLMDLVKSELINAVQLLGSIDVHIAIANLYNQFHEHSNVRYCFADYMNSNKPGIAIDDFWHPLLDPVTVTANSISLGGSHPACHIILTGSNRGGKSTLLKAVMLNILCAQTIGIVQAQCYRATPFGYLATYMNISDDTASGDSLFAAQVERAKKIVTCVKDLEAGKFGFLVIDEVFVGTQASKAAQAGCKLAKYLALSPQIIFIVATHDLDQLPKLEADTKGLCKNFNIDADLDSNGKPLWTHKLKEGISAVSVADEILCSQLLDINFE